MQKAISNKIQLGETLNPLDDYGGVTSINDEGTLENLITKVDKYVDMQPQVKLMEIYRDIILTFCQ